MKKAIREKNRSQIFYNFKLIFLSRIEFFEGFDKASNDKQPQFSFYNEIFAQNLRCFLI